MIRYTCLDRNFKSINFVDQLYIVTMQIILYYSCINPKQHIKTIHACIDGHMMHI